MDKGFSEEVADRAAKNVRESSLKVYESKWKIFCDWCEDNLLDPQEVSAVDVADFLVYLFQVKGFQVSTIKGYRSAIARVLKRSAGIDLGQDQVLSDLMANFQQARPFASTQFPKWDLVLVLNSLSRHPYEPIKTADFEHLSRKTAFLLLLASGCRRGELHALEVSTIIRQTDGKVWWLKPNPRFMAKNFNPATGKGRFNGFKITKLSELANDVNTDDSLCPVRALHWYVHRSKAKRGQVGQLFITCNRKGQARGVHKNTISSWVKRTIVEAYKQEENHEVKGRMTHEIRALSASFAFSNNINIEDILASCRWSSFSTFARHYLRDVSGMNEGACVLLPLQMARDGQHST
jgi:integrase